MLLRRPPTRNVSILTETTHEVIEDGQTVINFITFYIQKLAEKEIPKTVLILLTGNLLQLFINNFELIFIYACFNVSSSEEEEDNIEDSDDDEEEEVHDNVAVNLELPSAGHAIASVTADASPHAEVIAEASASPSAKRRRGSSAAIPSSPPTTSSIAVVRQKAAAASKNGGRKK